MSIPQEVEAIAKFWGGDGAKIFEESEDTWMFRAADPEDGFVYRVFRPGTRYPVYEDSGRPCGEGESPDWIVRCVNDAPDAFFGVRPDGMYYPYNHPAFKLEGWPT